MLARVRVRGPGALATVAGERVAALRRPRADRRVAAGRTLVCVLATLNAPPLVRVAWNLRPTRADGRLVCQFLGATLRLSFIFQRVARGCIRFVCHATTPATLLQAGMKPWRAPDIPSWMPEPAYPIAAETLFDLQAAREEARRGVALATDARRANAQADFDRAEQALAAAEAANTGRTEEAGNLLAAILPATEDLRLLFLGFQFYFRTAVAEGTSPAARDAGLERAESLVRRRLALAESFSDHAAAARAHTNLGLVLQYRGQSAAAQPHFVMAVDIDRRGGNAYGLARDLGNLGQFYETIGDLDQAEAVTREAMDIAERIGAHKLVTSALANLGDFAHKRGQIDRARQLWQRCISVCDTHGVAAGRDYASTKLRSSAR